MDILNRDFKRATIRGYKEDEVDEFLDRIAADYERILKENDRLKEQLSANEKEIAQFRQLEKNLKDTLVVAQNTAEEVMNAAKKNAEELRNNTKHECQNIREQAQIDARRQIEDASVKLRNIVAEYDKLVRDKSAFLLKMRTALEAELAITTQVLNGIPKVDEVSTQTQHATEQADSKPTPKSEVTEESNVTENSTPTSSTQPVAPKINSTPVKVTKITDTVQEAPKSRILR